MENDCDILSGFIFLMSFLSLYTEERSKKLSFPIISKPVHKAGEMAQWFRMIAALAEGQSLASTHSGELTITCNSASRVTNA